MSNAFVQEVSNRVFSGSSVGVSITPSAGNVLLVGVYWNNTGVTLTNVTDDRSQTYTTIATITSVADTTLHGGTAYAYNVAAGATTVTANFSGAIADAKIWVQEVSGPGTSDPLDTHKEQEEAFINTSGTDNLTSSAATTASNGDYIFGLTVNTASAPHNAGTNFTKRSSNDTVGTTESMIQTSAGSIAATFSKTDTTAERPLTFMVAIKEAGASPAPNVSDTATVTEDVTMHMPISLKMMKLS